MIYVSSAPEPGSASLTFGATPLHYLATGGFVFFQKVSDCGMHFTGNQLIDEWLGETVFELWITMKWHIPTSLTSEQYAERFCQHEKHDRFEVHVRW